MDTYSALLEARGRFVKLCVAKLTLDLYKTNYSIYVLAVLDVGINLNIVLLLS